MVERKFFFYLDHQIWNSASGFLLKKKGRKKSGCISPSEKERKKKDLNDDEITTPLVWFRPQPIRVQIVLFSSNGSN